MQPSLLSADDGATLSLTTLIDEIAQEQLDDLIYTNRKRFRVVAQELSLIVDLVDLVLLYI